VKHEISLVVRICPGRLRGTNADDKSEGILLSSKSVRPQRRPDRTSNVVANPTDPEIVFEVRRYFVDKWRCQPDSSVLDTQSQQQGVLPASVRSANALTSKRAGRDGDRLTTAEPLAAPRGSTGSPPGSRLRARPRPHPGRAHHQPSTMMTTWVGPDDASEVIRVSDLRK